ncbi:HWE histidine kinase domain-containing protein [Bradyrhizobium sp. OK095]|jgi:two-component sensor histidine kinase/DNA-binding NarL/FixJ family response regulator|uniref:sensor histidine kinase n=1 Tax=Bradyrhizobium sp. OK095 TaxID=1882760 RepID=UPI0008B99DE2|nr:HWE histidine kinase domain-containing protein [Bradyrhizobium sp. OK095]SEM19768.1 Two-component sensor histidine kinase, contains HisKA and HATPase domains [Bradyrhizobium sp. OK095]
MSSELTGSPANVLVVEDEMVLRMRAVDIVEDAGFTAVEAVNADEAISILETRSDISLLFTDIQMPGSMDGLKLAHAVHDRWPAIKIILVSGQVNPSEAERPTDSRFFGKPLGVEEMTAQLQVMIGAGALKIVPNTAMAAADETPHPSAHEAVLSAENDSLRLLLEQAGIDAKTLLAQAGIDAKEREAADKLQKLILGELHHRVKNTLATVSAIASQSFRAATSVEHGQKAMEGRLIALGRAHDLLMQVSWANASLTHTLSAATDPYDSNGGRRFHFNGPDVRITSGAVIALAMTFNELCTNTTKFGALSKPAGRVEVAWTIDEMKQRLRLTWTESGGPVVEVPTRRSFGTRMMESLGQQLSGQVHLAYEPSGFVYLLDVPLNSVIAAV